MKTRFSPSFDSSLNYLITRNRYTPSSIFGKYETRKQFTPEQARECFQRVWERGLKSVIEDSIRESENLPFEAAKTLLNDAETRYLNARKERRSVRYHEFPFIVQFAPVDTDTYEIDQVWFVHSHASDQNLVCVNFETNEEKQKFHALARRKGYPSGQELLDEFVRNFMNENS